MRRFAVTPDVDVRLHDFARGINVVTIETGAVIFVFTDDLKATNRSAVSFSTAGYPGRRGSVVSSVEIGLLLPQAHDDGRPECLSGRFDVTKSVMVPQPFKATRVAASAQNCESRFMIGIRPSACKIEASLCIINAVLPRTSMKLAT
jgi:hypothetical protein